MKPMPAARSVAIQVCATKITPMTTRVISAALPTLLPGSPLISSASVEIASKPRNDSTAIDTACISRAKLKCSGLYSGARVSWPLPAPPCRAFQA
ncbi:hypothetical protein D3C80_1759770 [compost metagenome]